MSENFEYFTVKFLEFSQNQENLEHALKVEKKNIMAASIYLNEILNFDLIKAFSDLNQFNKKIWTKVLFGNFDKIEFEALNKFFAENFERLNSNKIKELKKHLCIIENENKILKSELEKVIFAKKGIIESEKIRNIVNAALVKNRDCVSSKSKNDFYLAANADKSFNSNNNSLKSSSFRRKNHSKSFFIGSKKAISKKKNFESNNKSKKDASEKNTSFSISNQNTNKNKNKDLLDKKSFNKLKIIPDIESNRIQGQADTYVSSNVTNNSYLVSNSNNKFLINSINYNNETSSIRNQNSENKFYNSTTGYHNYEPCVQTNDAEPKTMLYSILDKYKNENYTNNTISNYMSGIAASSNFNLNTPDLNILPSRYINPYAAANTESNKASYTYNTNNLSYNADNLNISSSNSKTINSKYYAGGTYLNNYCNYNTINNLPHYSSSYYSNSNNVFTNNQNNEVMNIAIKEQIQSTGINSSSNNYNDKNIQINDNQNNECKMEINDQANQANLFYCNAPQSKLKEISVNDETFDDKKKIEHQKDPNSNRSFLIQKDIYNTSANIIENNKDLSVFSSSLVIDDHDKSSNINDTDLKQNILKKTKSFSRLKNANNNEAYGNKKNTPTSKFNLN